MNLNGDIPRWQSHKVVRAFKIVSAGRYVIRDSVILVGEGAWVEVAEEWLAKHSPDYEYMPLSSLLGGYFVVYDDCYTSFSPAESFERGYTRL